MAPCTFGIEEEYFICDIRTRNVRPRMSRKFYRSCKRELGDGVTNELLQAQIEVVTPPCTTMAEARARLLRFRQVLAKQALGHGLAIMAAGTHPMAIWHEQKQTPKDRYGAVMSDLQMLGRRNMLCGMHVHVEVPDPDARVEIMHRAIPFLPMLLALTTSSPFWQGHRTGLLGYRLAAYDELPRTGLPDPFKTTCEYQHYVKTLVEAGVIKDASYIWWAIRPSLHHPTLELRIADACTRLDDALCVAALFRCLVRHLVEHPHLNADLDTVGRAIAEENKWRAQRYGTRVSLIDQRTMTTRPLQEVVREALDRFSADAEALDCVQDIARAVAIQKAGSSADEQLRIYDQARASGHNRQQALKKVVDWLCRETVP
jgi:carboxylate-amine ligase